MSWFKKVFRFYVDGFREMTLGRTLWLIILIKVILMFGILRIFFFPRATSDFYTKTPEQYHQNRTITND